MLAKIIASLCTTFLATAAIAGDGVKLTADGKPLATIVVNSGGAIPAEKTAAKELADYLKKITGAEFATVEEKDFQGGPAIYVGWTEFAKKNGADFSTFGDEESLVKTHEDSLIVGGGRQRGTLYGVYDLLEKDLGVRWFTPWIENVPGKVSLALPTLDRRFKPAYEYRYNIAFSGAYPELPEVTLPPGMPAPGPMDTVRWLARNRFNGLPRHRLPTRNERGPTVATGRLANFENLAKEKCPVWKTRTIRRSHRRPVFIRTLYTSGFREHFFQTAVFPEPLFI